MNKLDNDDIDDLLDDHLPRVLHIRSVPREQAKQEVLEYYLDHKRPMYPSMVADQLRLDSILVFQLTEELLAEERLK